MEFVVGELVEVKGQEDGRLWEVLALGTSRRGEKVAVMQCRYRLAETELEGAEDDLVEVPELDVITLPVSGLHAPSGYDVGEDLGRHRRELVAA